MKDSGAELLLGDFSDNGNEQVPMGGNISSSRLEKRQGPFLIAGTRINLKYPRNMKVRTCTLGFAVRKPKGVAQFNQGYLTAGSCAASREASAGSDIAFVVDGNGNELVVGTSRSGSAKGGYIPEQGLDYNIVKVDSDY